MDFSQLLQQGTAQADPLTPLLSRYSDPAPQKQFTGSQQGLL
jgi:hypothetical protein